MNVFREKAREENSRLIEVSQPYNGKLSLEGNFQKMNAGLALAAVLTIVMTADIGLSLKLWNDKEGYIRGVPPPEQYFSPDEAISYLKQDTALYRVLPMNYERSDAGVLMGYGIQSAGGQMPNPLQSYQDFTGAGSSVMFQAGNLMHPNFLNLLNVSQTVRCHPPAPDGYEEAPSGAETTRFAFLSWGMSRFTSSLQSTSWHVMHWLRCSGT